MATPASVGMTSFEQPPLPTTESAMQTQGEQPPMPTPESVMHTLVERPPLPPVELDIPSVGGGEPESLDALFAALSEQDAPAVAPPQDSPAPEGAEVVATADLEWPTDLQTNAIAGEDRHAGDGAFAVQDDLRNTGEELIDIAVFAAVAEDADESACADIDAAASDIAPGSHTPFGPSAALDADSPITAEMADDWGTMVESEGGDIAELDATPSGLSFIHQPDADRGSMDAVDGDVQAEAAGDVTGSVAHEGATDQVESPTLDSTPQGAAPSASMIVDFADVVGGTPETSLDAAGSGPQSLGADVFASLEPWTPPRDDDDVRAPRVRGDLRFPEPAAFEEALGGEAADAVREEGEQSAEEWDPVPDSDELRQIVEAHAARGGDAAAIAAAIERVAQRVRRGEIALPSTTAEGDAAALALALAALLQPGRK